MVIRFVDLLLSMSFFIAILEQIANFFSRRGGGRNESNGG